MKLLDISPFVRYAFQFELQPKRTPYTSYDNRLFFIIKGSGKIYLNDVPYSFSKGTVMLWQAGTKYQFDCRNELSVICINFDYSTEHSQRTSYYAPVSLKNRKDPFFDYETTFFEDCEALNKPIFCHNAFFLQKNLNTLVIEHISQPNYYREKSSAIMKSCIINILRHDSKNSGVADKINHIIEHIQENYATELNNESLAALVDYHSYYLNRIFLKSKGVTLHQYIINYRITIAEQLLISTEYSIMEISKRVGFSSLSLFTTNFKKKNMLTPTQFRKKFKSA